MTDITVMKRALTDRAVEVAARLLPAGKRLGHEWCVGSIHGEPGESLKVCLQGAKAGVWTDFAEGGEGGDLIDLWVGCRKIDLSAALEEIRSYLGMERPEFERAAPEKQYRKPTKKGDELAGPVEKYLVNERKLSRLTLARYGVKARGRDMVFPSVINGDLIFAKYISIDRTAEGKKQISAERDCEPVLFGWPVVDSAAREIIIAEGEIDAMSWYEFGRTALSVPFGGGKGAKQRWIEAEFDRLARFEVIYLSMDMDTEGDAAVVEIVNRLGRHRCRRVKLPHKDANACLTEGITRAEMFQCIAEAVSMDPPELRRAGDFTETVVKAFYPENTEDAPGYRLPYRVVANDVRFRNGEMTLWTGESGHGKTQVLCDCSVDFIHQGARLCAASLEMAAKYLLPRMVRQAANTDRPTKEYIRSVMRWMNEGLWLFDKVGSAGIEKILEIFEYARSRYGCDVFLVDSLMRLGVGPEDYDGQSKLVNRLVDWAVEKDVHLHLVAHARKPDARNNAGPADINDVKGASEIASNAANVIAVWRNKKLEDEIAAVRETVEEGDIEEITDGRLKELLSKKPVVVRVAKQRNGDWEGKFGLWFNRKTYQYRSVADDKHGRQYVEFTQIAEAAE